MSTTVIPGGLLGLMMLRALAESNDASSAPTPEQRLIRRVRSKAQKLRICGAKKTRTRLAKLRAVVQEMHDSVSPDKECTSIPGVKCRQHFTEEFTYMDRCDTLLDEMDRAATAKDLSRTFKRATQSDWYLHDFKKRGSPLKKLATKSVARAYSGRLLKLSMPPAPDP